MKKAISFVLTIAMLLSCITAITFTTSAAPAKLDVAGNYVLSDENANLALYVDNNTGDFGVMNKKTNTVWYSTPIDWESDKIAQSDSRSDLTAKIIVKYITSSYAVETINSNKAAVISERVGKDWIITYYFKSATTNFSIPMKLSLKEDYLHVELLLDKLNEMGDNRVLYVQMLPMFGAAGLNDTGYSFMPDGTGSLLEHNRKLRNSFLFGMNGEGLFYAPNPTEIATNTHFTNWNEPLRLPVFGSVKNGEAFFTIVESGAAVSELRAHTSRLYNSYNAIHACVNVRDTQTRESITGTDGTGSYYSDHIPENYIGRYYFLVGDDANYIGMAEKYREYLINEKGMTKVKDVASNNLSITLYGAIKKEKHFLGIPYTGADELTTYDEMMALVDRLQKDEIDKVFLNYTGWTPLETTTYTSIKANSLLGGNKKLNKLIDKVENIDNYSLAFNLELQNFYKQNSDIRKYGDVAYGLDSSPVCIYFSRISAQGTRNGGIVLNQLIHPGHADELTETFLKNAAKRNVYNFSFESIGETLYCAYNMHDESTRDESAVNMTKVYQMASEAAGEKGIVSTGGGNGYAAPYVDNVVNAPVTNSRSMLASAEVPFYQIVFRGYTNLASSPFNLDSEQDELILRLAETGMSLYYKLMDAPSTSFRDTDYTALYACNLDDHYDTMVANYKRLKVVYDAVEDSTITNYEMISDDVKVTTFSNGAKVYTNYGDAEAVVGTVKIAARDFTVVGGANV